MNELERELRQMLETRAGRVARPGNEGSVLKRARRRRVTTAGAAALLSVALVSGAFAAIGGSDHPRLQPAAPQERDAGELSFASTPGEYPHVATGRFRNVDWDFRAAAVRPDPGSDLRLSFTAASRMESHAKSTTLSDYEGLVVELVEGEPALPRDIAAVFGVAPTGVASVDVEMEGGLTIPAHLFTGHDSRSSVQGAYYLAFVPRPAQGSVVARDAEGAEVQREPFAPAGRGLRDRSRD